MKLKDIRKSKGMTQVEVSGMAGIGQGNYCQIEQKNAMSEKTARKIAPVFGMQWYELLNLLAEERERA